jgi:hypothetical protein
MIRCNVFDGLLIFHVHREKSAGGHDNKKPIWFGRRFLPLQRPYFRRAGRRMRRNWKKNMKNSVFLKRCSSSARDSICVHASSISRNLRFRRFPRHEKSGNGPGRTVLGYFRFRDRRN